jgi:hypothetical protein
MFGREMNTPFTEDFDLIKGGTVCTLRAWNDNTYQDVLLLMTVNNYKVFFKL